MSADAIVREVRDDDLGAVAALVRESFDPGLHPFLIATQHGWAEYLRIRLRHRTLQQDAVLAVVELEGSVVGFADYRTADRAGFLSYICVAPRARGRGLARRLFAEVVARGGAVDRVGLDVFGDNRPALSMYDGLGFQSEHEMAWWAVPLAAPTHRDGSWHHAVEVVDLHQSLAALDRFGFCQLHCRVDGREVLVGRIGTRVLRMPSAACLRDARVRALMTDSFPDLDTALVIAPAGDHEGLGVPRARRLTTAVRMTCAQPDRILQPNGAPV